MTKFAIPDGSQLLRSNFLYGVATSSFQIEGDAASREKCIWDIFCEQEGTILDKSNGIEACKHVELWEDDVALIDSMGFDAYRLSLSWPRIIKTDGSVNIKGIDFYKKLLKGLKSRNIKTFVTLYHWDLPQSLEDNGGWLNRDTAFAFKRYTDVVVEALDGLVDSYATLNEPFCSSFLGYEIGTHAPGKTGRKLGRQSAHHLLLAHGLAMQVLAQKSPHTKNGIVLNFTTAYAFSDTDQVATERANQYFNHWYAQPLFDGKYPDVMYDLTEDERPDIEAGDMDIIAQPLDFLGVNFYTRNIFKDDGNGWFKEFENPDCERTDIGWEVHPEALTDILVELNERYDLPTIYITENGAATHDKVEDGVVNDSQRLRYYNAHLNALHNAIKQGVAVSGYFAWSLMDNFEWAYGYTQRFGIVHVDFNTQIRTIKSSGYAFEALIRARR